MGASMKAGKPLLELNGVSKDYGDVGVLRDVNLRLDGAEAIAIAGPSGSGKSTLLNIIGTLDRPTSGAVFFDGDDLLRLSADEIATMRNRKIGFVRKCAHSHTRRRGQRPERRSELARPTLTRPGRPRSAQVAASGPTLGRRTTARRDSSRADQSTAAAPRG